jgi:alkanesulfonate monooxygenase SsuD/methylene tetrahydromethanopterin reductase-like flavin-dependent oxidoreductase (luciferase family)
VLELAGRRLTFGVSYNFRNPVPWHRPDHELYAATLDHISRVEELGYDMVWTSEHHFIDDGYSPSVLSLCAAIAARTSRVRIGTQVALGPFYHPLRLAEDAATADILSAGRFQLGLGLGYRLEEYRTLGIPTAQRGRRLEELVRLLRAAWSPGELSFTGEFFDYHEFSVTPKPVQQPIPVWLGAGSEPAARRAGRVADGLLAQGPLAAVYQAELARARPGSIARHYAMMPWALVAQDPDRTWAQVGEHVLYQRHTANQWLTANGRAPLFANVPASPAEGLDWNPDIVVTPARARELVAQAAHDAHAQELSILWWAIPPGMAPEATYDSVELFADEMFPSGQSGQTIGSVLDTADRIALHELVARYGHLLDQRRWEDLDQVFTHDVRFEGFYDTTSTIAEKVALWTSEEGMKRHPLAHHATNVVITQEADGTVSIISKGIGVRASGEPESVTYRDVAVRTPAGWRITARQAISRRAEAERLRRHGRP